MKKAILIIALALGFAATVSAQPRAIGGRLGYGLEASYQHTLGGENFLEADLGLFGYDSINAAASYNFMIVQPQWTTRGEWGIYAGPGVYLGGYTTGHFRMGVLANVGLEYTFWFPLQLSADLRPQFGFYTGKGDTAYDIEGVFGLVPTISVRYRF